MTDTALWPEELRYDSASARLNILWRGGETTSVEAKALREASPSAEVQGHSGGPNKRVSLDYDVTITAMRAVGRYAVRLIFDDGHDSGLYTWPLLHQLSTASG